MDYDNETRRQREKFLSVVLGVLAVSGFLAVFFIICGGFSLYILAVVGGLALVGLVHYFLWGHSLSEQVLGETEEEEVRASFDDEELPPDETYRPGK
ncbi:MAG TPA: hypothetical protein VG013_13285 [Gemmataceae bacterium]|jgi:hypothetical protein|nr:hypothetical protein [Gemmataceae bacterium]